MIYGFRDTRLHSTYDDVLCHLARSVQKQLFASIAIGTDSAAKARSYGGQTAPTACAAKGKKGTVIYINAEAMAGRSYDEVAAIIAHEFAHVALKHLDHSAKSFALNERAYEQEADILAGQWGFRRLLAEQQQLSNQISKPWKEHN